MGWWLFALLLDVHSAASAVDPVRFDRAGQTYQDASIGTLEAGECADSDSDCAKWAEAGECSTNADYMRDACRLSCELCAEEEGKAALPRHGDPLQARGEGWGQLEEEKVLGWLDGGGRIDATYEFEAVDASGITLLVEAAAQGHERLVVALLQRGADVNLQINDGRTALMFAAGLGHEQVVDMLIQHGAEVNLLGSVGLTALMVAADSGKEQVAALLLRHGAKTYQQNDDGVTALMIAALEGRDRVVDLLLEHVRMSICRAESSPRNGPR